MKIELVDIDSVFQDPNNARAHDERNLETIRVSLDTFKQQKPIVVGPDSIIIAGNGQHTAAKSLGWKKIAIVRSKLDGMDAQAYAIADNKTAALAAWDDDALAETIKELFDSEDYNHLVTGFDDIEIEQLLAAYEVSEVPEPELNSDPESPGIQQMSFYLHDEQVAIVKEALKVAKGEGEFPDELNQNENGNALVRIVEDYLGQR